MSGSKQEDSLHTSSLVVQVGGSGEPQQVQVGVGNSVSNTQSRQEEPKQELAIVGKTEAMQQLTAAAPTKSQETDKRLSPTSPTIHESPEMKVVYDVVLLACLACFHDLCGCHICCCY